MITSGSARRNERMAAANVKSILGWTCTCRRPGCVISTGSSAVQIFMSSVLMKPSAGVQRRGLARAGRAHDEADAVGLLQERLELGRGCARGSPSCRAAAACDAARMRITTSSLPPEVGIVATRSSIVPIGPAEADLAVLGLALLGDVELRHDLEPLHERVAVRRPGPRGTSGSRRRRAAARCVGVVLP